MHTNLSLISIITLSATPRDTSAGSPGAAQAVDPRSADGPACPEPRFASSQRRCRRRVLWFWAEDQRLDRRPCPRWSACIRGRTAPDTQLQRRVFSLQI